MAAIADLRCAAPEKAIVEVTGLDETHALLPARPAILQSEKCAPETGTAVQALAMAPGAAGRGSRRPVA
ncbi:hypothetical protein [Methylobacterium nodulans]|uniref:hypothetical protein n=1 Tax=Methylobacterium nodulans TaxID=114616 RepID=UPI0002D520AE|nr:hypothetical protein [Methylobacterium nodulans]